MGINQEISRLVAKSEKILLGREKTDTRQCPKCKMLTTFEGPEKLVNRRIKEWERQHEHDSKKKLFTRIIDKLFFWFR